MEKLAEQKPEKILSGKVIHSFVKRFPGDVLQQKAFWIVLLLFVLWLFLEKRDMLRGLDLPESSVCWED